MSKKRDKPSDLTPFESAQIHLHFFDLHRKVKDSEEHQSEQRIRFFLTLTTGTVALIAVLQREDFFKNNSYLIILASLSILLLYGLLTFARIIWRNRSIDIHDKLMSSSGIMLQKIDPSTCLYGILTKKMDTEINSIVQRLKGTYAQFIYLAEGLLAAGIVLTIGIHKNIVSYKYIVWAVYVFLSIPSLLFVWSQYVRSGVANVDVAEEIKKLPPNQALKLTE
jgi:hypothetical protein